MWRCGCQHGCPPSWQGRWDVLAHWWTSKAWPFIKRWAWVLVVAGLIGVGFWLPTTTRFKSILTWINNLHPALMILAFVSIQTLLTVLFLPGALFVLFAGFSQGFWLGTLLAWTGSVLGAIGAFLLGRQVIAERVRKWAAESPFFTAVLRAIDSAGEGWKITLLLRLSPLMPYALINYLLSSTQISFWTYAWTTAAGVLPPTALYVYLGTTAASLSDILGDALEPPSAPVTPIPVSPDAPMEPVAPVTAPSAMDTTSLWVMGIGVVITIAVAVLVTVFTSRAIKKASRMGELEAATANMLEGSSAEEEDDEEVEMSIMLDEMTASKDVSSGHSSLANSTTSETELLDSALRRHSPANNENDSDSDRENRRANLRHRRRRISKDADRDDDDSDSDDMGNGGSTTPSAAITRGESIVNLDPPFSYVQAPANSRLSLADSHSSV